MSAAASTGTSATQAGGGDVSPPPPYAVTRDALSCHVDVVVGGSTRVLPSFAHAPPEPDWSCDGDGGDL